MAVRQLTHYIDERGYQIHALSELVDGLPLGKVEYLALVEERVRHPNNSLIPIPLKVPLDATSVEEAFKVFEEQCKAKVPDMIKRIQDSMRDHARKQSLALGGFNAK